MRFCKPICICIVVFVAVQMPSGLQIHCTNVILKANKHVHCILFEVQTPIGGLPNSQHKCDFVVCTVFIPLRISGDGAPKWFCREKGSTEYKSIQESGSKCTTKYKSREPKMAPHYKIQNKDHEKPPNKGCLENRLEKKLPLPRLESAQNRLCGVCSGLYFVENPPWSILKVLKT